MAAAIMLSNDEVTEYAYDLGADRYIDFKCNIIEVTNKIGFVESLAKMDEG